MIAEALSAIVGGVVGAVVGGPNIVRPRHYARAQRSRWRNRSGYRGAETLRER